MTDTGRDVREPARWLDSAGIYRTIFEQAGDSVLLLDPDPSGRWVILDVNEATLALHGYAREELVGAPLALLDPFAPVAALAHATRAMQDGQIVHLEATHVRKDGSTFPVEIRSSLLPIDGRQVVLSVERDVTQRRRAEEELKHSRDLMSYVVAHAQSAIAVHDRELRYIYVSERYLKEYNVQERDIIGRHHYDVFPDLPQKWRDVHQRALRGEVSSADEDSYPRADGTVEWTRWECRPWYEADGGIGGIIVYTEVITDRKRAADQRRALQDQLQHAMKMEAIGRLAGGVAHDFNNLLTSISGNVELCLLDVDRGSPLVTSLQDIGKAADSAAALTRQLLAFSRRQVLEPKVVDINELVTDVLSMLRRLIGEDIALRTALGRAPGTVEIDPWQMQQVLVNLVVNARDAMPEGGKVVISTTSSDVVEGGEEALRGVSPGRYVQVSVRDTGHGMDDAVKERIFEPFFTTKPRGRGTGLGLASVYGAVTQAGGFLDVESAPGQGTTMKIFLPRVDAPAHPLRPSATGPMQSGGTETILVVEDEPLVRSLVVRILDRTGYRVLAAASGAEAIAVAAAHAEAIHLLVTDVVMPGMNGRELAERLGEAHPETAVLFASGYEDDIIADRGVVGGEVNFIAKPFLPSALTWKVREILDRG